MEVEFMLDAQIQRIVEDTRLRVSELFPNDHVDAILFGSYARGDAHADSDLDILLLVDASKEAIARQNWQIGKIASDLFFDYELVVSPIVENRSFYESRIQAIPFYENIHREGVLFSA